jgi:hypothetical protein
MPHQTELAYSIMLHRTREVARSLLQRLEDLYARFPSDSVLEALCEVREWNESLERAEFGEP